MPKAINISAAMQSFGNNPADFRIKDFANSEKAVIGLLVFMSCMERLYSPSQTSGTYNPYIYVCYLLVCTSFALLHVRRVKYCLNDFVLLVAAFYFFVWSYSQKSLLYAVIVLCILFVGKIQLGEMKWIHRCLVIAGLLFGIVFCFGESRWSGFLTTSAPVFSLIMLASMVYLLFSRTSNGTDYLLAFVAFGLIFMTQTRVSILLAVLLAFIKFGGGFLADVGRFFRTHKFIAAMGIALLAVVVFQYYEEILGLIARSGAEDSNETRVSLMTSVISQWCANPFAFLFGNGGGYSMSYLASTHPYVTTNLPVHQDVLMLLCDYGIFGVGLFSVGIYPLVRGMPAYCLLILAAATFHNLFTAGAVLPIMLLTFCSLACEGEAAMKATPRDL